ncbi:hypothetical protein BD289DRAFT_434882 [Coniella lustricola]|uniref:Xylanolytic transcriptional activator regulatory domain-containing protein n=1 Tax=Coniella lustricola TaxID=2025994 RepID=A0A2T3A6X5_9PEZI|nr:hypothetical protein BD289DRAFT_434882 [Coniella lustricola]
MGTYGRRGIPAQILCKATTYRATRLTTCTKARVQYPSEYRSTSQAEGFAAPLYTDSSHVSSIDGFSALSYAMIASPSHEGAAEQPIMTELNIAVNTSTSSTSSSSESAFSKTAGLEADDYFVSSTSPSASREELEGPSSLSDFIAKNTDLFSRLTLIFFKDIHPYWPILHEPTFDIKDAPDLLVATLAMLASWSLGGTEYNILKQHILKEILITPGPALIFSLPDLQAQLFRIVYALCCREDEALLMKAVHLNAILVSTCRGLGIFDGGPLPEHLENCAFRSWLAKEQIHRLAFSVLRVDAYLAALLNQPPSVRYQELNIPLPKSPALWSCSSEQERRNLQWKEPGGRDKALFSCLMRDALAEPGAAQQPSFSHCLTALDRHLGLCALQNGVWEAASEAHSAASDELVTKLTPGSPIKIWRSHLKCWRQGMEAECHMSNRIFCPEQWRTQPAGFREHTTATSENSLQELDPVHRLDYMSLTLWHMSSLKMHTPLSLLQQHSSLAGRIHPSSDKNRTTRGAVALMSLARLRTWMASQCPRIAVWNAAQIARLFTCSTRPSANTTVQRLHGMSLECLLNPLAISSLLTSALVALVYARQTMACQICVPRLQEHPIVVDLFDPSAADMDPNFELWRDKGEGQAVWGSSGITLCKCQSKILYDWFMNIVKNVGGVSDLITKLWLDAGAF